MQTIQYIIDSAAKNTANGRGSWLLHNKQREALRNGGKIDIAFEWDMQSRLRINLHRFAAKNQPMDCDGLAIAFKPVRDGVIEGINEIFNTKFDDGNQQLFYFAYSQCKAPSPVFADTVLVTIDLLPEFSPYSSVIIAWGYMPAFLDKDSLIATLSNIRADKLQAIADEIKCSRPMTRKVANLEKEQRKTKKAMEHCVAAFG